MSVIVQTINELVDNMNLIKCYNKSILEGVSDGVLAVSLDGRVSRANKAFYGYFRAMPTRPFWAAIIGKRSSPACAISWQPVSTPANRVLPAEIVGGGRILEASGNRMIGEDGEPLGSVFVFRDATLARRYEREVQEKEARCGPGPDGTGGGA